MLKRELRELENVLGNLKAAQSFLMSERILVCSRRRAATTTLDFTNAQGDVCCEINKAYGSKLAQLHRGIRQLEHLLADEYGDSPPNQQPSLF